MECLKQYVIPENVQRIHFNSEFLNIDDARSSESDYISALSTMVYLEELANSEQIQEFNIKQVQMQFHTDNIVKFTRTVNILQYNFEFKIYP